MDRRTIRALATGMIFAALILYSFDYFLSDSTENQTAVSEPTNSEDTVLLTKEEHDSLQSQLREWENRVIELSASQEVEETDESTETDSESESDTAPSNDSSDVTTRFILRIESGMTSPDISEQLVTYDIISDESAFNEYLNEQQLTDRIQIGEYDLNSSLSIEEIAALITR